MKTCAFRAMGTAWWLHADGAAPFAEAEALVHGIEARLSRFRPDSALSALNRERRATCATLAAVTRAALELRAALDGAFDPTLGAELRALGYDRSFERLIAGHGAAPGPRPAEVRRDATHVRVEGDTVWLDGPGDLDLGGLAKGWAVDRALELLLAGGASRALVDGGGDLRGAGAPFAIGLGDGHAVTTAVGAIATSSTRRRSWRDAAGHLRHHILSPATGWPADTGLDTASVIAPDAVAADALATAILAAPDRVVPRLGALGAHALVRGDDGAWWMTPGAPIATLPREAP